MWQVDEEKGYRTFGGCPFVYPSTNISTNMRETAKQNRYNGKLLDRMKIE